MCMGGVDKNKTLIKDQFYVIKIIDVARVPFEVGLEALKEIETMQALDSPYIVGYYDSFIED
jgi:serine/threonine protein kinase